MKTQQHINISDKQKCSGCNACHEICPQHCISMSEDSVGALYPKVDISKCIECGACTKVCPFINPLKPLHPKACYAAININLKDRLKSSSGGVFVALAREVISKGGVVIGAVFTADWNVKHVAAETMEEVLSMMGSKYVQSDTQGTYSKAREYLNAGRSVLYSGTPCQIAGLKHYLKKDYSNLLAVEVICHGTPTPGIWQSYLDEIIIRPQGDGKIRFRPNSQLLKDGAHIESVNFRDKREGWKKFGFALSLVEACKGEENSVLHSIYQPFVQNEYMHAFLRNWSLRPSCYSCEAKSGKSQADLTIGDFWGVEKYSDLPFDDKGTSCVVVRSAKGAEAIRLSELNLTECKYTTVFEGNPSIEESVALSYNAKRFNRIFRKYGFCEAYNKMLHPSILYRFCRLIKRILRFLKSPHLRR